MQDLFTNQIPLKWCHLHFEIVPYQEMSLPSYPAITIRGGLGYELKKAVCTCHQEVCDCEHVQFYRQLYEDQTGIKHESFGYIAYNRPLIIRTRHNFKRKYTKNDSYQFEMILFGKAIQKYRDIILAMRAFGLNGIGEKMEKFYIKQVQSLGAPIPVTVYHDGEWIADARVNKLSDIVFPFEKKVQKVKIQFHTPTRIQVDGRYQEKVSFDVMIENLLRRINSLLYFHQNQLLDRDVYEEILNHSKYVEEVIQSYQKVKYRRFSTRQHQEMFLHGIEGWSIVKGSEIHTLLPLLYLGQFCHIGKQTTFGFGEYSIEVW
ncbi:CRISPR system precrRNA processing endoribonuclease RAMP protein Cas6 [Ureibacillus thermosphaericus]|uniref:CRISPR-associated endoribonuclease Cas6 n=1 Tax=Ureibacillus thermosphaericus TaxID=51173 RepID=A0A840PSY1_URETH|nr:CRISPR system precrRNA processing endoribonuclease RAMP protein Cas6 [Ureibacillus thermosphaericus]MBB5149083.1 CRISPR-associated endoribonuclease Cas6 [Ureibacillus thermosphaericus]NKZ31847.1 CRISPR system precrRNA processing endoribonuclease RAMP protein Cas6 [Ureibacillus thermosphaericus]